MRFRRSVLIQLLAVAVAVGMSMLAIPFLRDGRSALAPAPLLMAGLLGLTFAFARGRSAPSAGLFGALALASVLFLGEQAALVGAAGLLKGFFAVRVMLALAFGVFFGLAPVVARVEQNPWFGVRTPWTLGSRRVWKATHRATARLWMVGGALGSLMTLLGAPLWFVGLYLTALLLAPAAVSYSVWRKLGRP